MAALLRLSALQGLKRGVTSLKPKENIYRTITTSPKKAVDKEEQNLDSYPSKDKIWISYGFDNKDKEMDRHKAHIFCFCAISVFLVLGGTFLAYYPDLNGYDWAQREAYLQLRYREEHGLPLVDPNLIDPSQIILPTDEELGDTEIII